MAKKSKKKRGKQTKSQAPARSVARASSATASSASPAEAFAPVESGVIPPPGEVRHSSGIRLRAEIAAEVAPASIVDDSAPASVDDDEVEVEVGVPSARDIEEALAAYAEEQRGSRRVAVAVDIHLASDSHFFSGLSGDISEGGLFLSTYRPLPIGSSVEIEFSLPGSSAPLRAHGEVRWLREHSTGQPQGVGIAFDDLADDDRESIHRFCTMRPALYYDDVG